MSKQTFAVMLQSSFSSFHSVELISYPTRNLTLPLGRTTPAVFHCVGRGTFLLWKINGTLVPDEEEGEYEQRGFTFASQYHSQNRSRTSTVTISVSTLMNNNTKMNCHATGNPGPRTSPDVFLTIAGIRRAWFI